MAAPRPARKDTLDLDAMMGDFAWDDAAVSRSTAAGGTKSYVSAELSGPAKPKARRADVDMGDFDSVLNNMMSGLSGLNIDSQDSLFRTCDRCNDNVATVDAIELAGRFFHERCAPVCPKCKRNVNPRETQLANRDEVIAIKGQLAKAEKTKSALQSMGGMYAAGSKEASGVANQIADADADIRRFQKKIEKLENVGPGVTFVQGSFFHPACFTCAVDGCRNEMPSDEFADPATGRAICRQHFFEKQGMVCASCALPIDVLHNESSISVEGKRFHQNCFKCHHCKKAMKQYRAGPDTHLYCKECHTRMF
eukprot:c26161_g1_i1.p2 GENE.c26161_g1_i1~~c26161_g1_i1.p2  ORF type:complete len:322 (+),score=70.70 c26161_g1_i1:41-967(+)